MERWLTCGDAAKMLGMNKRKLQALMASGEIESYCANPGSERERYLTTESALGRWQERVMCRGGMEGLEHDRHGNLRLVRRR